MNPAKRRDFFLQFFLALPEKGRAFGSRFFVLHKCNNTKRASTNTSIPNADIRECKGLKILLSPIIKLQVK